MTAVQSSRAEVLRSLRRQFALNDSEAMVALEDVCDSLRGMAEDWAKAAGDTRRAPEVRGRVIEAMRTLAGNLGWQELAEVTGELERAGEAAGAPPWLSVEPLRALTGRLSDASTAGRAAELAAANPSWQAADGNTDTAGQP